jgi:hypothetical protein
MNQKSTKPDTKSVKSKKPERKPAVSRSRYMGSPVVRKMQSGPSNSFTHPHQNLDPRPQRKSNVHNSKKSLNLPSAEEMMGQTYDGSTLTSMPSRAPPAPGGLNSFMEGMVKRGDTRNEKEKHDELISPHVLSLLSSDDDSMENTWAEIADASLVVERAINRIETMKSDDTDTSHRIQDLLSMRSSDDGDVERALHVLRKHAERLGVRESDLLLAVKSDGESVDSVAESETRTMTFTEEIMEAFQMYTGTKTPSQKKKVAKSARKK